MSVFEMMPETVKSKAHKQYYLLSAALFKPLGAALANALQLLAAEAPDSLLSQVCMSWLHDTRNWRFGERSERVRYARYDALSGERCLGTRALPRHHLQALYRFLMLYTYNMDHLHHLVAA
jgi:hypothetical protein